MTLRNGSKATLGRFLAVVTGLIFLGGCGGSSSSSNTNPITGTANNLASVSVGFGINGASGDYFNGIWTTVTICAPGSTTNCQAVDNVLVDTGSTGLRILNTALNPPVLSSLGGISSNDSQLQECVQFGDTSFAWGPVLLADVEIAGEKASSTPIQVIGDNAAPVPSQCLATPVLSGYGNDDSVATLGANGLLGIAGYPWDCGSGCASGANTTQLGYPYYFCPTGQACSGAAVPITSVSGAPLGYQVINPVAGFSSSDNNGVLITLPSIGANGAADGTVTGKLIFGIGTQTNNAIAGTVYAVDEYGNIPAVTYNGVQYSSPNNTIVLDTGSNLIYFLDASTLASAGIIECTDNAGFYCPASTIPFSMTALGGSGTSGTIAFNVMNADTLFATNNAAFNDIAGDGGTSAVTDDLDFGLPFFFGRTVYVGMMPGQYSNETSPPSTASTEIAPYGYYAF
jgi:hypothetical protein